LSNRDPNFSACKYIVIANFSGWTSYRLAYPFVTGYPSSHIPHPLSVTKKLKNSLRRYGFQKISKSFFCLDPDSTIKPVIVIREYWSVTSVAITRILYESEGRVRILIATRSTVKYLHHRRIAGRVDLLLTYISRLIKLYVNVFVKRINKIRPLMNVTYECACKFDRSAITRV
jgi:hypothetical protein